MQKEKKELEPYQNDVVKTERADALIKHMVRVNEDPPKTHLKTNKLVKSKPLYLPIGRVEQYLDYYFGTLWQVKNFKYQIVVNEIIGDIELHVKHPITGEWIVRAGTGAVMIQQYKGADVTDIGQKIKNTLSKDMGHLKAECVKNAAKSLGKVFGRDLNRDFEDMIEETIDQAELIALLSTAETRDELIKLWRGISEVMKSDYEVKYEYLKRMKEITKSKNGNTKPK